MKKKWKKLTKALKAVLEALKVAKTVLEALATLVLAWKAAVALVQLLHKKG